MIRRVENGITSIVMDENDVIEYESKACRIVSFNGKYYLQIKHRFEWLYALDSEKKLEDKDYKAKEYDSYNAVMIDVIKLEK